MRNILSAVRGWVVFLGSGVALIAFSQTNQNCVSNFDNYTNKKLLSSTMPCDERGAEGKGALVFNGIRGKVVQWGYWKNGNPIGIHIRFSDGIGIDKYSDNGIPYPGGIFWPGIIPRDSEFIKYFNTMQSDGINSKLIGLGSEEALNELKNWRRAGGKNATSIAKIASTGALPAFANAQTSGISANQRESLADDPKVFGRGARGG